MAAAASKEDLNRAQAVGLHMSQHDEFSKLLGIQLDHIEPGCARTSIVITKQMVNGLGICHGGVTFSLADTAFAYACNSRNHKTVALNCVISFTQSAQAGETLTATAQEQVLNGKTGIYDIIITNASNEVVSFFRGTSYRSRDEVIQGLSSPR